MAEVELLSDSESFVTPPLLDKKLLATAATITVSYDGTHIGCGQSSPRFEGAFSLLCPHVWNAPFPLEKQTVSGLSEIAPAFLML